MLVHEALMLQRLETMRLANTWQSSLPALRIKKEGDTKKPCKFII